MNEQVNPVTKDVLDPHVLDNYPDDKPISKSMKKRIKIQKGDEESTDAQNTNS